MKKVTLFLSVLFLSNMLNGCQGGGSGNDGGTGKGGGGGGVGGCSRPDELMMEEIHSDPLGGIRLGHPIP